MSDLFEQTIAGALRAEVDEYGIGSGEFDLQIARSIIAALKEAGIQLVIMPKLVSPPSSDHRHQWALVSDTLQGQTQVRIYECPACLSHTTLTGPIGVVSPFEVEEKV